MTIFLLKSGQLKIWTDFTRANYSVLASEEDCYLSIDLCLCLYCTFTEIYIQASTSSYYDCSPMSIIQSSCNVFYFRRYYFQTSHFLSIFFWKLEFFHYLHLFYITYLLVVRCVWHLLLSSQLAFNYQKHTNIKDFPKCNVWSKLMVYGKTLQCWKIQSIHCLLHSAYKRNCKNPPKTLHLVFSQNSRFSRDQKNSSQDVKSNKKLFSFLQPLSSP